MNLFEGQRVRLRAVEPDDWRAYYEWNKDSESSRRSWYINFPASAEFFKQRLRDQSLKEADQDVFRFQIETLDGTLVGTINTHHCDLRNGTFSYGLAIMPQHQRKGYGREAILLVLRYFFLERRYQKVTVEVVAFNTNSIRLHESLGFQQEGRLRRMWYTDGAFHDVLWFGMTREEFRERHPDYGTVLGSRDEDTAL